MSPKFSPRVFEPFFTTKDAGKGTGLGLSMVYGFMKQSGGHIKVYSEVGAARRFKLYLASALRANADASAKAAAERRAAGRHEVILAVDDNADVRTTVTRHLRDLGYQVITADGADGALHILDAAERIDLLFTDVVMPGGMDGKALADVARKARRSQSPVHLGLPRNVGRRRRAIRPRRCLSQQALPQARSGQSRRTGAQHAGAIAPHAIAPRGFTIRRACAAATSRAPAGTTAPPARKLDQHDRE